ncbi:MAG: PepSY-associated TM helix domain-containing protein [Kiloniellales bacterium]
MAGEETFKGARALWLRVHRYLGLGIAGFLVLSGSTGAFIAFEREVDAALNPELYYAESRGRPALPLEALVERLEAGFTSARVRAIALPQNARDIALVRLHARAEAGPLDVDEAFVDPYSGEILGARLRKAVRFDRPHLVPMIREFHESLYLGSIGEWLLGGFAFAWFVSGLIGFYLTLPGRRSFIGRWRKSWLVARKRLTFDLHRAGGLWCLGLMLVVSASGLYLSIGDFVVRPLVSQLAPLTEPPGQSLPRSEQELPSRLTFDEALVTARRHLPATAAHHRPAKVHYLVSQQAFRVDFVGDASGSWAALPAEQFFIDAGSGAPLAGFGYLQGTAADKLLLLQLPLHSGKILGSLGQATILVFGLVTVALSVTGLMIWWRRRSARQRSHDKRRATATRSEKRLPLTP